MPSSLPRKLRMRAVWGPPHGRATKNSVLVALFILLISGLSLMGVPSDVSLAYAAGIKDTREHWAAAEIDKATAAGYVKGYPDGKFKPNTGVTRAELIVMLNRAFSVAPGQTTRSFKDIRPRDWFAGDVKTALAAGYVNGYQDNTFRPQKPVNRQEAACLLAQLLKLDGDGVLKSSDAAKIEKWAKPAVGRLMARGIMSGYPGGAFQPLKAISRAEAVVVINKALALRAVEPVAAQLRVVDDPVNLRSGPSRQEPVIGQVRAGDILRAKAKSSENWYQIAFEGGTGWIAGWCVEVIQQPPPPPPPPALEPNKPGTLTVQVRQDSNGATVDITGAKDGNYRWVEQSDPQRLVVTVPGVTVVRTPLEIEVGKGGLDKIITRFPGPSPGTAEVEIDFATLPAPLNYEITLSAPGELQITVLPQIYKIQSGVVQDFLAVNIWATAPLNYQTSKLSDPARLIFDFTGIYLAPALQGWQQQVEVEEAGVNSLRIGQYQAGTVRLVAETSAAVIFNSDSSNGDQQIVLRIKKPVVNGRSVVLDPGHGGEDPGAIGPHGLMEKDVNLAVTLKAADILRKQGVTVTMTRSTDVNLGLGERCKVANNIFATVFVSIHCNASKKPDIGGTGSYTYAPPGTPLGQMRDERLRLAQNLQEELSKALGLRDAGVFEENFAVLRGTSMPAVLVEVAFISNAAEEKLLSDPNFQQRAAEAIAQGIDRYLAGN